MSHPRRLLFILLFTGVLLANIISLSGDDVRAANQEITNNDWDIAVITESLIVRVQPGAVISADDFAGAFGSEIETVFDDLLLFLDLPATMQPIQFDFYRDFENYRQAIDTIGRNELDGQIAIADPNRATISIPIDAFSSLTRFDADNQLRHAIAHIVAGWASDVAIPRGFDEGLAQYVERPNLPVQARSAALVQTALQNGKLASWSNLNREQPLNDAESERAQSYAMVAWFIEYRGLPDLRAFLDASKSNDTWRDAMNDAVAPTTVDQLERQWKDAIPVWTTGGWRWNLMTGFDLEPARIQLERGNFKAASRALDISEQLLRDIHDPQRATEVAMLKDQARIGDLAETKMVEAQQALEQFVYDRAAAAVGQAEALYAQLPPEIRPDDLMAIYADMAARGMAASNDLEIAHLQAGNWADYADARALAHHAGAEFADLGDAEQRDDAANLIQSLDHHQLRVVLLLAALAILSAGWLVVWSKTRGPQPLRWE